MPSSVIGWTTAAIFYFVHNILLSLDRVPSLSGGISIDVGLAHKWTPLHPQPLTYVQTGHIQLSPSNIERRMEKWNRFGCVRVANQVRAFAFVHSHTHTRSGRRSGTCVFTRLELFVLVYGWWDSLSANREKIIRYGIGCHGSVTAFVCIEQCSNWSGTFRMSTTALPTDKWMIDEFSVA